MNSPSIMRSQDKVMPFIKCYLCLAAHSLCIHKGMESLKMHVFKSSPLQSGIKTDDRYFHPFIITWMLSHKLLIFVMKHRTMCKISFDTPSSDFKTPILNIYMFHYCHFLFSRVLVPSPLFRRAASKLAKLAFHFIMLLYFFRCDTSLQRGSLWCQF